MSRTIFFDFAHAQCGAAVQEKSLVTPSGHKSLNSDGEEANLRRLSGSRGGSGRQDAVVMEEAVGPAEDDEDLEACVAREKANRQGVGQKKEGGAAERGGDKVRGGGQTSDGSNRRTRKRNRCYRCDGEYH